MKDVLAKEIYNLEMQLLKPEVRTSSEKVADLLSDDFIEFCSSGYIYRHKPNDAIDQCMDTSLYKWDISDFSIKMLSEDIILATYILDKDNGSLAKSNRSLRSSIWKRFGGHWKMIFHQGTLI